MCGWTVSRCVRVPTVGATHNGILTLRAVTTNERPALVCPRSGEAAGAQRPCAAELLLLRRTASALSPPSLFHLRAAMVVSSPHGRTLFFLFGRCLSLFPSLSWRRPSGRACHSSAGWRCSSSQTPKAAAAALSGAAASSRCRSLRFRHDLSWIACRSLFVGPTSTQTRRCHIPGVRRRGTCSHRGVPLHTPQCE